MVCADCRDEVEDDEVLALMEDLDSDPNCSQEELVEEDQEQWGKGSSSKYEFSTLTTM